MMGWRAIQVLSDCRSLVACAVDGFVCALGPEIFSKKCLFMLVAQGLPAVLFVLEAASLTLLKLFALSTPDSFVQARLSYLIVRRKAVYTPNIMNPN